MQILLTEGICDLQYILKMVQEKKKTLIVGWKENSQINSKDALLLKTAEYIQIQKKKLVLHIAQK